MDELRKPYKPGDASRAFLLSRDRTMNKNIRIHVAQFDDQGHLGPMLKSCLGTTWDAIAERAKAAAVPASSAEDEFMAADDWYFQNVDLMNCVYFAWDGKERVGAVVINVFTAELMYIVVLPSHRRQGIGRELLKEAMEELKERGVKHLTVRIPQPSELAEALPFFEACGLQTVRSTTEMGMPVL